jgi:hypothetical protein
MLKINKKLFEKACNEEKRIDRVHVIYIYLMWRLQLQYTSYFYSTFSFKT